MENKQHIFMSSNYLLQIKLILGGFKIIDIHKEIRQSDNKERVCLHFLIEDKKIGIFKEIMDNRKEPLSAEQFEVGKKLRHEKIDEYYKSIKE